MTTPTREQIATVLYRGYFRREPAPPVPLAWLEMADAVAALYVPYTLAPEVRLAEMKEAIKREINYRFSRDHMTAQYEQEQALDEAADDILALPALAAALRAREERDRFRSIIEQAVIRPENHDGGTTYPVKYGEYTEDGVFVPPAELPNIPALEERVREVEKDRDEAAEENARLIALLDGESVDWNSILERFKQGDEANVQLADRERTIARQEDELIRLRIADEELGIVVDRCAELRAALEGLLVPARIAVNQIICMGGAELCQPCQNRNTLALAIESAKAALAAHLTTGRERSHETDRGQSHRDNSHDVPPEAARSSLGARAAVAPDTGSTSKELSNSAVAERGIEPRGCPTPGACSCVPAREAERKVIGAARQLLDAGFIGDHTFQVHGTASAIRLKDALAALDSEPPTGRETK